MAHGTQHNSAFAVPVDHLRREARQWLATRLDSLADLLLPAPPWIDPVAPQTLYAQVMREPAAVQIPILLACVERMVWYPQEQRANLSHPRHGAMGALLYAVTCRLYQRRLPYTEAQICTLL